MVVKENQHELYANIDLLFQSPPLCKGEEDRMVNATHYRDHGRIEDRTLETSAMLSAYVNWPGAQQVIRRTYHAVDLKTGAICHKATHGITNLTWTSQSENRIFASPNPSLACKDSTGWALSRARALPQHIAALRRAHWSIENGVHYVRDETFREDRCRLRTGHAAQAQAAPRKAVLNVLRDQGWSSIPAGIRRYGAALQDALLPLGVPAP